MTPTRLLTLALLAFLGGGALLFVLAHVLAVLDSVPLNVIVGVAMGVIIGTPLCLGFLLSSQRRAAPGVSTYPVERETKYFAQPKK